MTLELARKSGHDEQDFLSDMGWALDHWRTSITAPCAGYRAGQVLRGAANIGWVLNCRKSMRWSSTARGDQPAVLHLDQACSPESARSGWGRIR